MIFTMGGISSSWRRSITIARLSSGKNIETTSASAMAASTWFRNACSSIFLPGRDKNALAAAITYPSWFVSPLYTHFCRTVGNVRYINAKKSQYQVDYVVGPGEATAY